jgi:hypothetical protein
MPDRANPWFRVFELRASGCCFCEMVWLGVQVRTGDFNFCWTILWSFVAFGAAQSHYPGSGKVPSAGKAANVFRRPCGITSLQAGYCR